MFVVTRGDISRSRVTDIEVVLTAGTLFSSGSAASLALSSLELGLPTALPGFRPFQEQLLWWRSHLKFDMIYLVLDLRVYRRYFLDSEVHI